MKKRGIFVKVFVYTTLFSALLVGAATFILLQQLLTFRSQLRLQSIVDSYNVSFEQGETEAQALRLFDLNQSFPFYIMDKNGNIVYETNDASQAGISLAQPPRASSSTIVIRLDRGYELYALANDVLAGNYGKWAAQAALTAAAMLAACIIGSFVFARLMTKPINALVDNTKRMARLEEVPPMPERKDELGDLARDVHSMYVNLKETISELEREILRARELEEARRYFFSAASHDLKTPVAATSALLESMLANIGDYKDHPKYLRECLKMMDSQSRMISEILEIVSLDEGKLVLVPAELDIGRTVAGVVADFQPLSEANRLRVVTDIPGGLTCFADPKALGKALASVMLNAVQNTPAGGEIRIWCEDAALAERRRLCLLNTGAKIDEAVLPKLFDPFFRMDKARSRQSGRSGLGLAIVRKTLEAMQVDFALENAPDGVLFWMELRGGNDE
ncbi:MAG: HAMP domain-containing histidine kinase [Gracilibacteraceae bacterium]|jgi:two-component system sensor histidine kinase VanS|nr:HAMP domain-containing histidine kinase [Gracilibacteraceae bacterium]